MDKKLVRRRMDRDEEEFEVFHKSMKSGSVMRI